MAISFLRTCLKQKQIFTELAKQNVPNARESLASVEKIIAEKNKQAAAAPMQPAPKK